MFRVSINERPIAKSPADGDNQRNLGWRAAAHPRATSALITPPNRPIRRV